MDAFTFDTSGGVAGPIGAVIPGAVMLYRWSDLDAFTQGYVEALFAGWLASMEALPLAENLAWPDFEEHPDDWPWPTVFMDREGYRWDIVRLNGEPRRVETGTPLSKDEWGFSDLHHSALAMILADCAAYQAWLKWPNSPTERQLAQAGRDFCGLRQRGNLGVFFPLSVAERFPPLTASLGDDGKVYLRDAR